MRFSALDGWRGVCALIVAAAHAGGNIDWTGRYLAPNFAGGPFVDYFFVLSGFVIGYTYDERIEDLRSAGTFMIRRFGRLWPLHAALLALYILLEFVALVVERHLGNFAAHPAFTGDKSPHAIVTNLLLVQSLGLEDMFTWNSPSWSVSVEFWTYVVFAALVLTAGSRRAIAAGVLLAAGMLGCILGGYYMDGTVGFGFFRCIYGFFLGYLVFRFTLTPSARLEMSQGMATIVETFAVLLIVAFVIFLSHGPWSLIGPPLFALSVYVFSLERGLLSRQLSAPPFRQLGIWSYSIYMIHMLMLTLLTVALRFVEGMFHVALHAAQAEGRSFELFSFGSGLANDVAIILFLIAVVIAASLSFRFIENPCRRYANSLADRLGAAPRAAPGAV